MAQPLNLDQHAPYSPLASRLIGDPTDSTTKSTFSPLAFENALYTGTDSIDEEAVDHDEVLIEDEDSTFFGAAPDEQYTSTELRDHPPASISNHLQPSTPAVEKKPLVTFTPTPYKIAVGRNYSRDKVLDKVSAMHIYGALGVLTLLGEVLHMCHVLPATTSKHVLKKLARGIGEEVINLNSSLNFWTMSPTFHYAVDTGLIKFLPTTEVMVTMKVYLGDLRNLRNLFMLHEITLEEYNKRVHKLERRKLFPAALYPYMIVGVLCQSNFIIPRHDVDDKDQPFEIPAEDFHNQGTKYQITIKRFPVPLRRTPTHKVARVLPSFRAINPTNYNKNEIFWLWQDPFFVVINAGEFVHTLRERWEKSSSERFNLRSFTRNEEHSKLLNQALALYEEIIKAPAPPDLTEEHSHDTPSRPPRASTRSRTTASKTADKSKAGTQKTTNTQNTATGSQVKKKRKSLDNEHDDESRTEGTGTGTSRHLKSRILEPQPGSEL